MCPAGPQFESGHTDPGVRQRPVGIHVPRIIDGCLAKYITACFFLWTSYVIQKSQKIVLHNIKFRP